MKNLFYYLHHYGDVPFSARPFCEVDALILSQVAYLNFDAYLQIDGAPERLADLDTKEIIDTLCQDVVTPKRDRKLWLALLRSERYREAKLFCHVDDLDLDGEAQFSAVTFLFEDFSVVAFRGTDLTLLGWKEDFNMSHLAEIPSQTRAVAYLDYVASLTDVALYVCGHSKGGNLAVYAGYKNLEAYGDRIHAVYNFDGPGFPVDIADDPLYRAHHTKFHKYVPFGSLVGVLLHHSIPIEIVQSKGFGITQHILYNWKFEHDGYLSYAKQLAIGVPLFDAAMKEWTTSMTAEEAKIFVDSTFDTLGARDGATIVDFVRTPRKSWLAVYRRYKALPRSSKRLMLRALKGFFHSVRVCERRIRHRNRDIRRKARETAKLLRLLKRKEIH